MPEGTVPVPPEGVHKVAASIAAIGTVGSIALIFVEGNLPTAVITALVLAGAIFIGAFVFVDVLFFWIVFQNVRLSPDRVEFVKAHRTVGVQWADLVAPKNPHFITSVFTHRVNGVEKPNDPLTVSENQARAIFSHPSYVGDRRAT